MWWSVLMRIASDSRLLNYGYFIIRKYQGTHTCLLVEHNMNHWQVTYKVIGRKYKLQYVGVLEGLTTRGLVNLARKTLKAEVSYWKGWKARQYAHSLIRGSPEEIFPLLPLYRHILKLKNPETVTRLQVNENKKFKYFLWLSTYR